MDHADRIADVRRLLADEGADTLVAASSAAHSIGRPDPVFHLTGYRPVAPSLAIVGAQTTTLIAAPAWDVERAAQRSRADTLVAADDPVAALAECLRGMRPGRLASVGVGALPHALAGRVGAALGEAKPVDAAFHKATARKTDAEIDHAREATRIAETGYDKLLEIGHGGMRECDLAVELRLYMESIGADDNFLMFNASPHNRAVQPSSSRKLQKGDVILAEITPSHQGQFTQICRTVSVGTPSNALADKYALVVRAMKEGIAAVRPGVPIGDACAAIDRVLTAEGYGEYCKPPHIRRRGHGLGFGSMMPGDVATDNPVTLEENMFFVVHPNQYIPETGYLLCGEPVRVVPGGHEVLSARMAELGTIPA